MFPRNIVIFNESDAKQKIRHNPFSNKIGINTHNTQHTCLLLEKCHIPPVPELQRFTRNARQNETPGRGQQQFPCEVEKHPMLRQSTDMKIHNSGI